MLDVSYSSAAHTVSLAAVVAALRAIAADAPACAAESTAVAADAPAIAAKLTACAVDVPAIEFISAATARMVYRFRKDELQIRKL
jgi:hypothetical protein